MYWEKCYNDKMNEYALNHLKDMAIKIRENAYAPYSKFKVGAVVYYNGNTVSKGVNVENASYGLTICAERNAITTAIAEGMKIIETIVISCNPGVLASPCGACRQFIAEFSNENTRIYFQKENRSWLDISINELLPYRFIL